MSPQAPRGPVRTCVGCRSARAKELLVRVARTPSGVRVDPEGRLPGRGAYLCPDIPGIEAAATRGAGALRRALRGVPAEQAQAALEALHREVLHHRVPQAP